MEKCFVTQSRLWHEPKITTLVNGDGILVSMEIDDFKKAVLEEIGSVALVFTVAGFKKIVDDAFVRVLEGAKKETTKFVH